jgi:L-Ala-D/L-Glu epimerase
MRATARRESVAAQIEGLPGDITREALQTACRRARRATRSIARCGTWRPRRTGRRVWELAGCRAPGPLVTAFTLSLDTPEKMRAAAAKNAHRPLLKIKLGTPDDMPRLEAVRAGARRAIIVDANEGWTAEVYADLAPASAAAGRGDGGAAAAGGRGRGAGRDRAPAAGLRRRKLP